MWGFMLDHDSELTSRRLKQKVTVENFSLYCTPNAGFLPEMYYNMSKVEARFCVEYIPENTVIETRPFAILVGICKEDAGDVEDFFVRDVEIFVDGNKTFQTEFHQYLKNIGSLIWRKFKAFGIARLEMMYAESPEDDLADPVGVVKGSAAKGKAAKGKAAKGKAAKGSAAKGKAANGKAAKGKAAKGSAAEGNAAGATMIIDCYAHDDEDCVVTFAGY